MKKDTQDSALGKVLVSFAMGTGFVTAPALLAWQNVTGHTCDQQECNDYVEAAGRMADSNCGGSGQCMTDYILAARALCRSDAYCC